MLLQTNMLTENEITTFQQQAGIFKQTLFQFLTQHELIDAQRFAMKSAQFFQLPYFALEEYDSTFPSSASFPLTLLKNYFIFPIESVSLPLNSSPLLSTSILNVSSSISPHVI